MTATPTPADLDTLGPYDREPGGSFIGQDQRRALLAAASAGIELGDYDRRILDWLAGWDPATVRAVAGILYRARLAGYLFGPALGPSATSTRRLVSADMERPTALEVAEARSQVNRHARQRRHELAGTETADLIATRAETRAAAELLADWFAAGRRRGIPADDWHIITRELPALALQAMVLRRWSSSA